MKVKNSSRRDFVRLSMAGAAAGSLGLAGSGAAGNSTERHFSIAGYDYDRVRSIKDGRVGIEGASVSFNTENIYSASGYAFGQERRYDITEIGLIPFLRRYVNQDFRAYSLIPIFISRTFRHRNIFVHTDSGIKEPEDLRGRRVGTPGYGFSANTWIRGFLLDQHNVKADDFQWIETTESSDGGPLPQGLNRHYLPDDFPLVKGPPGVDESQLLLSGECDALITAITPRSFLEGNPKVRRLFPDVRMTEQQYYSATGLFPIMHAVAIRSSLIESDPWLPRAVFAMYTQAKQHAYESLATTTALNVSLPWITQEYEATRKLMGENYWKYGIEANRRELESAVRYAHEQGLLKRRIDFEELFHDSTLKLMESDVIHADRDH